MFILKGLATASALALLALPQISLASSAASSVSSDSMDLVIGLKERVSLETLAQNAIQFGITYTPEEIRAAAGPSDADYRYAISQLEQEGFTIVKETKSHLFVTVRASQSTIENSFQTRIESENGIHRPMTLTQVPAHLDFVKTIVGLDNSNKRIPRYRVASGENGVMSALDTALKKKKKPAPADDQPGILPAAIKTDYGFDSIYSSGIDGTGQNIDIATYDGIQLSEVSAYYTKIGLTTTARRTVETINVNGTAVYNAGSAMETELDAEFSGMIAPGANIHIYTSAENSDAGELGMFTQILDDNKAKVVNYSWGSCETNLSSDHKTAMDSVFNQAVAQGVNIFVASGDSGSDGCGDGTLAADYPASSPGVVAVGGTTLVNSGGTFETAWNGSGGGVSAIYALPSYQSGFQAPYTMRSIPDVSFNADPNTGEAAWESAVDQNGSTVPASWVQLGGTSIAAPQWAGFTALVGQARANAKKSTLGYINPILYGLSTSATKSCLNDVTSGSNGQYSAGPGFDAVTGLGSPQAGNLFSTLSLE